MRRCLGYSRYAYMVHLSWVNNRWRYVAVNSFQLWTDIYYGADADMPRMLVCLERSGTAPVSLEMRVTRTTLIDDVSLTSLISTLLPHFHRVRAFRQSQYEGGKPSSRWEATRRRNSSAACSDFSMRSLTPIAASYFRIFEHSPGGNCLSNHRLS